MKKIIILSLLVILSTTGYSQGVKWGPRIGMSSTQLSPNQLVVTNQAGLDSLTLDIEDAQFGYNAGLFLRIETKKKFFIHTELHFSTNTVKYQLDELNSLTPFQEIASETYYDLNLPFHLGLKFGPKIVSFRLQGGAIISKTIGGSTTMGDIIEDYTQAFEDLNVGWQMGVGLDIWKITLDVRYEGDFGKYASHMEFFGNDVEFEDRERQLKFSLGWKF